MVASELFESVLKLRSERLGRGGGDYETPSSIAKLMSGAVVDPGDRVLDPACGIGTSLLHAARRHARRLEGWDIHDGTVSRARMRFELSGIDVRVEKTDSLVSWTAHSGAFDSVLLQPPFGLKVADHQWRALDDLPFGRPGRSSGDYAWLQCALGLIKPEGRAAVLLPAGSLLRSGAEEGIRRQLLHAGLIEAIVSLPGGMIANTGIASALWILRGTAPTAARGAILLANAGALASTGGEPPARAELADTAVEEVLAALEQWRADPNAFDAPQHLARPVALDEIDDTAALVPERFLDPARRADAASHGFATASHTSTRRESKGLRAGTGDRARPHHPDLRPQLAGKSSLLQTLLLLKQSIRANTLVTQGDLTDAGSFSGLVHRHQTDRTLTLGVTYGAIDRWDIPAGVPDPSLLRSVDVGFGTDGPDLPDQRFARFRYGDVASVFHRSPHTSTPGGALFSRCPSPNSTTCSRRSPKARFCFPSTVVVTTATTLKPKHESSSRGVPMRDRRDAFLSRQGWTN